MVLINRPMPLFWIPLRPDSRLLLQPTRSLSTWYGMCFACSRQLTVPMFQNPDNSTVFFYPIDSTPDVLYYGSPSDLQMGGRILVGGSQISPTTTTTTTTTPAGAVLGVNGTFGGGICSFPFTFQDTIFTECTCQSLGKPWCAFTYDFPTDQKWGYCTGIFNVSDPQNCYAGAAAAGLSPLHADTQQATAPRAIGGSGASSAPIAAGVVGAVVLAGLVALLVARRRRLTQRYGFRVALAHAYSISFSEAPTVKRAFVYQMNEEDGLAQPRHIDVDTTLQLQQSSQL